MSHKKMILSNKFLQKLQYFREQIPRELLGGEQYTALILMWKVGGPL